MKAVYFTTVMLVPVLVSSQLVLPPRPEDASLNFIELANKYGHTVDAYDVVTEDGYILTVFRIPGQKEGAILLMHGLIASADEFIVRGKLSLAITLADQGHDVWVGNTRGNKYARRHEYLNPDVGPDFWDFSFHEAGYYDLAATIDFILKSTGEQSIRTIGHSQGTIIHFVLFSTRPEYNEKVKGFIALAPIAFLNNLEPPDSTLAQVYPLINILFQSLGIEELLLYKSVTSELIELICSQEIIGYDFCYILIAELIGGFDPTRIGPEFWKVVIGHFPAATNRKNLSHFSQLILNKRFAKYDYGTLENLRRYSLFVPPSYDLRKVTANVTLVVGKTDALSRIRDVDILRSMLPTEPIYHLMEPTLWNHFDFVFAYDIDVYLYPYLFSRLHDYE